MMYQPSSNWSPGALDYDHHHMNAPTEDIKFGDASPVVQANRDKIVFDEFEYDSTSMRRTVPLPVHHSCLPHVHPPHVYKV